LDWKGKERRNIAKEMGIFMKLFRSKEKDSPETMWIDSIINLYKRTHQHNPYKYLSQTL
jgi:endo-beta-N-acetylglucosaminidase D